MAEIWNSTITDDPTRAECGETTATGELAFIRAKMEGATAEEITAARMQSVILSLREAISLTEIIVTKQIWERIEASE